MKRGSLPFPATMPQESLLWMLPLPPFLLRRFGGVVFNGLPRSGNQTRSGSFRFQSTNGLFQQKLLGRFSVLGFGDALRLGKEIRHGKRCHDVITGFVTHDVTFLLVMGCDGPKAGGNPPRPADTRRGSYTALGISIKAQFAGRFYAEKEQSQTQKGDA